MCRFCAPRLPSADLALIEAVMGKLDTATVLYMSSQRRFIAARVIPKWLASSVSVDLANAALSSS